MTDKRQTVDLNHLSEDEAIEHFLKETTVFLGPDPEIMNDHSLAPRSALE